MDGILWEESSDYHSVWFYMNPYGFLEALTRRVCRHSDWELHEPVWIPARAAGDGGDVWWQHFDETIVPDAVYRGLDSEEAGAVAPVKSRRHS